MTIAQELQQRINDLHDLSDEPTVVPELELVPPPVTTELPPVMDAAAYYGLAGEAIRAIAPTTEADSVAVLVTLLTMFGNACGRGPHVPVGDARHGANIFAVLVGETSRARKGTALDGPKRLMMRADAQWTTERVQGGLSSGEGLIWAVHDELTKFNPKTKTWDPVDPAIADKRVLAVEEELSQVLKTAQRQGATVSEIIRRAWDSRSVLATMTKTSPARATDAHISILGHITKAELARQITETDLANGLANRFAWFRIHRSQLLPNPIGMDARTVNELGGRIAQALAFAREIGPVARDSAATELWNVAYAELERDRPGLAGAITARASPITLRLALIYALLDKSRFIRPEHLEAALAVWEYADASVTSIFGELTGDAVADRIITMLRSEGRMTRNDLMDAFGRNVPSARIGHALDLLHQSNQIRAWRVSSDTGKGRPRTYYEATTSSEESGK